MAFIILEGVDRSGKSTLAKAYESQGYKYIHFDAPDKKYTKPGYTGPSYLDDMIDLLVSLSGQDVVFDRSWYGEIVWPQVYGRRSLLTDEDIEVLQEIESNNSPTRILMYDTNVESHWKRCVDNKEPLSRTQFDSAYQLYDHAASKYQFTKLTKQDVDHLLKDNTKTEVQEQMQTAASTIEQTENESNVVKIETPHKLTAEQLKLQQANAINDIMSSRIVKKKGSEYDIVETKIRSFLNVELSKLLGTDKAQEKPLFSEEEITLLKALVNRIREKRA